jgi:F-type H+-transporting ATPase subunit b
MTTVFSTIIIFFAAASGSDSGFSAFWDQYINYPAFEVWRFVNLAIFVLLMIYLLKKPLSETFKAKREEIRSELIKAEEAKKAAIAKLTEVEAKLAGAEAEISRLKKEAREEIETEKLRLISQAETEAEKLKGQAAGEIVRVGQVAKLELRRFAVEESLRLAEEKLRIEVTPQTDSRLIRTGIKAIGGLN